MESNRLCFIFHCFPLITDTKEKMFIKGITIFFLQYVFNYYPAYEQKIKYIMKDYKRKREY